MTGLVNAVPFPGKVNDVIILVPMAAAQFFYIATYFQYLSTYCQKARITGENIGDH